MIKIINASCQWVDLVEKNYDAIITDPPYEINYQNNEWDREGIIAWDELAKRFHFTLSETGNLIIFSGWTNFDKTKSVFERNGFTLKNVIAWDRIKGRGAKTNLVSTLELILWFVKDPNHYTYNKISSNILKKTMGLGQKNKNPYRALSNCWTDISPIVPWAAERNKHPTQKPLQLMERIARIWTDEGDNVLDPFAGSGTTGLACANLNRNCVLIEKEKEFVEIMQERLKGYEQG